MHHCDRQLCDPWCPGTASSDLSEYEDNDNYINPEVYNYYIMFLVVDSTAVMVLYTAIMIMFYCVLPGTYAVSNIKGK